MTKEEKTAEIMRLIPYAIRYAQDWIDSKSGRVLVRALGSKSDVHAFAQLFVVDLVNSEKPAAFLKQGLNWAFNNVLQRSAIAARKFPTVSIDRLDKPDDALPIRKIDRRAEIVKSLRFAVFKATSDLSPYVRGCVRDSILNSTHSYARVGISRARFQAIKRGIFKEIKKYFSDEDKKRIL